MPVFIVGLLLLNSCTKDFDEINSNPASFTTASDGSLFNQSVNSLKLGWNEQFYIHNEILYKQTQMAALYKEAWGNSTIGSEEIWSNYYTVLPNLRELEKRISTYPITASVNNMKAMVKIILAYKTFRMTDYFGDIPFSEAGYGFMDINKLRPKFDNQRSIYLSLLEELKWADENITVNANSEPLVTFKKFDKLFNGDMLMWQKLANSLRLRYSIRMFDKEPTIAGPIISDIITNQKPVLTGCNFSGSVLEAAAIYPYKLAYKNEAKWWSFREHRNLRMGTNMWHQMSTTDAKDGSGIFDVRAFFFFETNNDKEWVAYPQYPDLNTAAEGGVVYEAQRIQDAGFNIKGDDNLFSPFNFFVVSDEDYMPEILMTGAEVHFLKAEAYMRGLGVAQSESDASNEYLSGVQASIDFWTATMAKSKLKMGSNFNDLITVPSTLDLIFIQNVVGLWNFTSTNDKLKAIYTQTWIDLFRQPAEAYSLVRRVYGKLPRENATNDPLNYFRLTIPPSEVQYNLENYKSAYAGKDFTTTKMWWMSW